MSLQTTFWPELLGWCEVIWYVFLCLGVPRAVIDPVYSWVDVAEFENRVCGPKRRMR
jgi:hypothetical protein